MGSPEWRYKLRKNALELISFMPFRRQSDKYQWLIHAPGMGNGSNDYVYRNVFYRVDD
jgi:hypothetical protein